MKVLLWIVLALSLVAVKAARTSKYLDRDRDLSREKHAGDSKERIHRENLSREESVKAGREAKYEYTTFEPTDEPRDRETTSDAPRRKHTTDDPPRERKTTSEEPRTTERKTTRQPSTEDPRSKTTTSTVPIDDRTTTEETSSKSVIPEDVSHAMRWLVGGLVFGIFVVIVSMFAYKFYRNRAESGYQNL